MDEPEKFRVMDEFTMYRGEEWNAEGCTVGSDGYWVRYEDHKKIVEELKSEIAAAYNCGRVEGWQEGYHEGREDG